MLKPLRLEDSVAFVSRHDDAIDAEKMTEEDWKEYDNLCVFGKGHKPWRECLKLKDGASPTVFLLGVVPSEILTRIGDECRSGQVPRIDELEWRCFLHGVRAIENWPGEIKKTKVKSVEYVDPEWLRDNFVRGLRKVALNIGFAVWSFNQLSEDEQKN